MKRFNFDVITNFLWQIETRRIKKKFDRYTSPKPLFEYIVKPEDYLKDIEEKIISLLPKLIKENDLNKICNILIKKFRKNKIIFIASKNINPDKDAYISYGINESKTAPDKYGTIAIELNPLFIQALQLIRARDKLLEHFLVVLKHELIHRGQVLKIKDNKFRLEVYGKNTPKDQREYLGGKQEIMARAWEITEYMQLTGISKKEILQILKTQNGGKLFIDTLKVYHEYFTMQDSELKLLYKYMYWYLE